MDDSLNFFGLMTFLGVVCLLFGCGIETGSVAERRPVTSPTSTAVPRPTLPPYEERTRVEVSTISPEALRSNPTRRRVPVGAISDIEFIDSNRGFVIDTSGALFRTDDGGSKWGSVKLPLSGKPVGILFRDENLGFILLNVKTVAGPGDKGAILTTYNGGLTWEISFEGDVTFFGIRPGDDGERVFGTTESRVLNSNVSHIVILHTLDNGKTWSLNDDAINALNDESWGAAAVDLFVSGSRLLILETKNLIESKDGGKTWSKIDAIEAGHLAFHILDAGEDRLIMGAGSNKQGDDSHLMTRESPGKWRWTDANRFNSSQMRFISKHEILACGYTLTETPKKSLQKKQFAALAYSPDSGASWRVVLQDRGTRNFDTMKVTGDGNIFVAGGSNLYSMSIATIRDLNR